MGEASGAFLSAPGRPGMFGALMDEYARAADGYCRAIEGVTAEAFGREFASEDPDTVSLRAVARHTVAAARGYADYILRARGMTADAKAAMGPVAVEAPADVRPQLVQALRYTEKALEGMHELQWKEVAALTFQVRWGPVYDPESMLEHAIVHLLRHRRQVERWEAERRS